MTHDAGHIEECLPANLRSEAHGITVIAAGLSGAGVYLVKTDTAAFVLKITGDTDSPSVRRRRLRAQQEAGEIGVGPRVLHIDEERGAIVTVFVQDRSFGAFIGNPATRDPALLQLAQTLRVVHTMDAAGAVATSPSAFLDLILHNLREAASTPAFVIATIDRVRALPQPPGTYTLVLSHNDVNPSNLVYDGERIMLLDWDTCGAGDPYYDLAAASVFFRMDDATCVKFISAHDGSAHDGIPINDVPARFRYNQCVVAALCGGTFIRLATSQHSVHVDTDTIESLADIYLLMRSGAFDVRTPEGQSRFGIALLRAAGQYARLFAGE